MVRKVNTKLLSDVTPYDPEFVQQMEVAEEVMREDWNVLRKLAT